MATDKRLGIWMDHTSAHLIEFSMEGTEKTIIESKFTREDKEESLSKSENIMHNKEQHQQSEFYKSIGEAIRNYNNVIIFGPTNAKSELHNSLKSNHLFNDIKIEVESADKMSDSDQHNYVRDYFSKQI